MVDESSEVEEEAHVSGISNLGSRDKGENIRGTDAVTLSQSGLVQVGP
jgi:hypothetical protein